MFQYLLHGRCDAHTHLCWMLTVIEILTQHIALQRPRPSPSQFHKSTTFISNADLWGTHPGATNACSLAVGKLEDDLVDGSMNKLTVL